MARDLERYEPLPAPEYPEELPFWLQQELRRLASYVQGLDDRELLQMVAQSSDPADPDPGKSVIWQSDGTGVGADGDVLIKITDMAGITKTVTLVDFSAN